MWSLIILSHFLMLLSFTMLSFSTLSGHFFLNEMGVLTLKYFSIYAVIIYVFTQSLILFLIITINKNIKEIIQKNALSINDEKYSLFKYRMHMHTSLNLLFVTVISILYGAVHTGLMSLKIHNLLFLVILFHYAYNIYIQYQCFKRIIKLISRVNGIIVSKL